MTEHQFTTELLDIAKLEPNPRNVNEGDVGAIATAIAVDGFHGTVICQDRGKKPPMIVVGEHRWRALRMLQQNGIELHGVHRTYEQLLADKSLMLPPAGTVPGQVLKMDDTRAIRKMLADNRASALSMTADAELVVLLTELANDDALFGSLFEGDDIDVLLAQIEADAEASPGPHAPDTAPPVPDEPISKTGDIWVLGEHRLLCGDSRMPESYERLMGGAPASMVWTDPPYGVAYVGKTVDELTIENDDLDEEALRELLATAFGLTVKHCNAGAVWFVSAPGGSLFGVFGGVLAALGIWRHTLIWVKDRFVMGRADYHYRHEPMLFGWVPGAAHDAVPDRTQDTVWEVARPGASPEHPTMKPVELVARAIRNHTAPGGVVLDPFAGSGTTIVACEQEGRVARAIEFVARLHRRVRRSVGGVDGETGGTTPGYRGKYF